MWRADGPALSRIGRRLWLAALVALLALAALIGPFLISSDEAGAHPVLNCWTEYVERNTGGSVTWTEAVRRCVAVAHPHPPPNPIAHIATTYACGRTLWFVCPLTHQGNY